MAARRRQDVLWPLLTVAVLITALVTACARPLPPPAGATPAPTPAVTALPSPLFPQPSEVILDPDSGLPLVGLSSLPDQATETMGLIGVGGPYPYPQDGVVFENREGILPEADTGYYHEYTVSTPGSADRGARRIVIGNQGEAYWTADHYISFSRIAP